MVLIEIAKRQAGWQAAHRPAREIDNNNAWRDGRQAGAVTAVLTAQCLGLA
jgi:hypothetical protein